MPPLAPYAHVLQGSRALLNGFSQIFLQAHPGCGLLVLLAIAIGAPQLLGGALLGGLSSTLTAQRRGYAKADIELGLYGYNGVLLGLLISLQFAWSALLPLLIILSAGLSSLLLAASSLVAASCAGSTHDSRAARGWRALTLGGHHVRNGETRGACPGGEMADAADSKL